MDIRLKLLSFVVTLFFVAFIFSLLRNRKLKESLSLVWLFFSGVIVIVMIFFNLVEEMAELLWIKEPNNLLFLFAIVFTISACIIISVEVSNLSDQIKNLSQELALFKNKMEKKKNKIKKNR